MESYLLTSKALS